MSGVTREHRAEAARLLRMLDTQGRVDVSRISSAAELEHWIETGAWPNIALHEEGRRRIAPVSVAQALADRDARIGELEKHSDTMAGLYAGAIRQLAVANDSHDTTKAQLERVVGVLRELRDDVCGSTVCVSRELRTRVDSILKELDHA